LRFEQAARITEKRDLKGSQGVKTREEKQPGWLAGDASREGLLCLLPRLRVVLPHIIQQRAETLHHQKQVRHAQRNFVRSS
jgi:hypothetical protein